ncbi:2-keto-4-pentenoate hydratase [Mycobacterium paraense]|uniref:2-keto-4-pentenoate hydratase n=1 Tax=Mycobacterium paraense TaxID=767916 RepID=A0ABX3VSC5_9MYCO|nr:fumarylacetoacetate hydrolase family protein [Mycobacterium paraense]ORW32728.1 2-keto-4-pentenoate hydratase [Mycobacterium paraense]ORW44953.1 2-keto-4-pentenoate hydratase [Mycobacterium paraense]
MNLPPVRTQVHDRAVLLAAERLSAAADKVTATQPVRHVLGSTDVRLAYAVQDTLTAQRLAAGARIVGRKVGLTSVAVQQQLGVSQPDSGVLFDDMSIPDGATINSGSLIAPKVEAELAFMLKADLDNQPSDIDYHAVTAAVDYAVAALEIVDSRIINWDITIADTIADNASCALYVLGEHRVPLTEFNPINVTMTLNKNGQRASSGRGDACLGDPLNAVLWLARTVAHYGMPLRAGEVILSGALGPMVSAEPGTQILAELSTLGSVSVRFSNRGNNNE